MGKGKDSVHPRYGKKVLIDGKHVGYINDGTYSSDQVSSVGLKTGTRTGKKFDTYDRDGKKIGTAYNKHDALYMIEKENQNY